MEGLDIYDANSSGIIPRSINAIFDYIINCNEKVEFIIQVKK